MTFILQLKPPLPLTTPKGPALAHFLIDEGIEHHLYWVCFGDDGEIWTWSNPTVRAEKNITYGRKGPPKGPGCAPSSPSPPAP